MKIGLIDVDSHNWPNIALMKISAYHKTKGHNVDWWNGLDTYDAVYMAKVFSTTPDEEHCIRADKIIRGGTGYGATQTLPNDTEYRYPDYSLYPQYDAAYGYLTRGCPRNCPFCIVTQKEGAQSKHVADLDNFWRGQKEIKLLDPNLLACSDHEKLLWQLIKSKRWVDFTQGLDARLLTPENMLLLVQVKTKHIHFAWDNPDDTLTPERLAYFAKYSALNDRHRSVYILTNYNSTHEQDLMRVYKVWEMGYSPYVMIYDKKNAPQQTRYLQRWANNKIIFKSEPDFSKYNPAIG